MLRSSRHLGRWRPVPALCPAPCIPPARAGSVGGPTPLATSATARFAFNERFCLARCRSTAFTSFSPSTPRLIADHSTGPLTESRPHIKSPPNLKTLPGASIMVSEEERKIFDYLVDVVKASNSNTELRVAGGWVRDKLLEAKASPAGSAAKSQKQKKVDLDIALNNMMGQDFARHIMKYNKNNKLTLPKIGIVRINPDKSKHLETAVVSIFGHSVDLVNLRTERYGSDSRIPTSVGLGSPTQDSLRRDFTVNALYFNIRENRIEDYTGHGLADLEAGLLRTPDEPLSTLLEDPLRVLRGIRFKAMFSFDFVPELFEAMRRSEVQEALRDKVSRQRVGVELNKMLRLDAEKTLGALEQIAALDLHDVVFPLPPYLPYADQGTGASGDDDAGLHGRLQQRRPMQDATGAQVIFGSWSDDLKQTALRCLREQFRLIKDAPAGTELILGVPSEPESLLIGNGLALASSFLFPALVDVSGGATHGPVATGGGVDVPLFGERDGTVIHTHDEDELTHMEHIRIRAHTEALFKHGLSLSNDHAKCVADVLIATKRLLPLIDKLSAELESASGAGGQGEPLSRVLLAHRVELGNWMRSIDRSTGGHAWETAAQLAFITRTHLLGLPQNSAAGLGDGNAFVQAIKDSGLASLSEIQPLLSGREIMEVLQVQPSRFVGEVKAKLISWQMANLGRSTKEEAIAFVTTLLPTP